MQCMNSKLDKLSLLINFFKQHFGLNTNEIEQLLDADIKDFKKGEIFLKEGQKVDKCFFVIKGCVRQYYIDENGKDITVDFYTEFQAITLDQSKVGSNPYYLECLEDSFITADDTERTNDLYAHFPQIESISRQITEQNLFATQDRMNKLLSMKPEDRYLDLLQTRPDLLQRVPQHQIASYLGLQPESLSRIRKRLAEKRK